MKREARKRLSLLPPIIFLFFTAHFGAVLMESAPSDYLSFRPLLNKHIRSSCLVTQFASAKSNLKAHLRCSQFRESENCFSEKRGVYVWKGVCLCVYGGVSMERGYLRNVNGAIQQMEKIGYWSRLSPSLPPEISLAFSPCPCVCPSIHIVSLMCISCL